MSFNNFNLFIVGIVRIKVRPPTVGLLVAPIYVMFALFDQIPLTLPKVNELVNGCPCEIIIPVPPVSVLVIVSPIDGWKHLTEILKFIFGAKEEPLFIVATVPSANKVNAPFSTVSPFPPPAIVTVV